MNCNVNLDSPGRKESTTTGPTKFEVQIVAQFDHHNSQVWRVSWNITSTLLASSGDDGCVRLWKGEEAVLSLHLFSSRFSNGCTLITLISSLIRAHFLVYCLS